MSNSTWINTTFEWCVELLTYLAQNLGTTYQALNVWLFVIIFPALLLVSFIINLYFVLKPAGQERMVLEEAIPDYKIARVRR
jgi:hypothetical protein|tara:strand:- start:245 stop:490 length:246 start_codon:yes stop_codon:yes gene_type:complete